MDVNQNLLETLKQDNLTAGDISNLLQQDGISVNYCHPGNYETPLHIAAVHGSVNAVAALLSSGACVNAGTADLVTPLHEACLAGHYGCVEMLMNAGAQINARNIDGSTPLCYASAKGCRKILQLLITSGAEVNPPLSTTFPPLHEAVLHGNWQCIWDLIQAGANLDKSENQFGTALHVSCLKNHCNCTKILLLAGAHPDSIRLHQSPLHLSAQFGCRECIELLVAFGADVTKKDLYERTAMDIVDDLISKDLLNCSRVIPRSLLQCCRLKIRKSLGPLQVRSIKELPIPTILKGYLDYNEFSKNDLGTP